MNAFRNMSSEPVVDEDGGIHMCFEAFEYLCRAAFESPTGFAAIPATHLRLRLPQALRLCGRDCQHTPQELELCRGRFRTFVEKCELSEKRTGRPLVIGVN